MWGGFAFGMFGAVLAAVFLRGVGVVGHKKQKVDAEGKGQEERIEESESEEQDSTGDSASQLTAAGPMHMEEGKSSGRASPAR